MSVINTDKYSISLRARSIDIKAKRLLVTNFSGTEQEKDFLEPANCRGFGRVRHFRRSALQNWPQNPLPIDPARKALKLPSQDLLKAQVFQNSACNWRCWYCFVPFELLTANVKYSGWFTCSDLIDMYLEEPNPPPMIDLTGGQPDLIPEWVVWMMQELYVRGLHEKIYLWSDDNLSNDYFWKYLSEADIELFTKFKNYGRVCCFKGFDSDSFAFNTQAHPDLFDRQFQLFERFLKLGIDLYAYITLPCSSITNAASKMSHFVDRLQELHANLPLRVVPLKVQPFTPVKPRLDAEHQAALDNQQYVVELWVKELQQRFTASELSEPVTDVRLAL